LPSFSRGGWSSCARLDALLPVLRVFGV